MYRRRNSGMTCRCIAVILACLDLPSIAECQPATHTDPPGFHLYIRMVGDKATYKLGEAIYVEVACKSDFPQRYTSACGDNLAATHVYAAAVDAKSKLALESVDTLWIGRTLCPSAQYHSDELTGENTLPVVGEEVRWQKMLLYENYPLSAGRFRIRAVTRGASLTDGYVFTASSTPDEISVEDDPQWRSATLREAMQAVKALGPSAPDSARDAEYARVRYFPDLEALHWSISELGWLAEWEGHPDRAAVARFLREYLYAKVGNTDLKELVDDVLALELAAGSPKLYARAVAFEGALGEPSPKDLRDLRAWLLPRYRRLLLEIARSMITAHKRYPDEYLEYAAEDLAHLNVPECPDTRNFLSESELRHFMRDAGLSSEFITEQMAKMRKKTIEMGKGPTKYQREAIGFWRVTETPPRGVSVKWLAIGLGDSQTAMTVRWPNGLGCQMEDAEIRADTITVLGGRLAAVIHIRGPKIATVSMSGGQIIFHMRKTKEPTNLICE
jgi:hypothetical protein